MNSGFLLGLVLLPLLLGVLQRVELDEVFALFGEDVLAVQLFSIRSSVRRFLERITM